MAAATGDGASVLVFLSQLAMTAHAHAMVSLLQSSLGRIQIGREPKAGLILVARSTLDTLGVFFQFALVHYVLSAFKPVVTVAALDFGIDVLHVGKVHRRPASTGEYRLIIQQDLVWLSVQLHRPQADTDNHSHHPTQIPPPLHGFSP